MKKLILVTGLVSTLSTPAIAQTVQEQSTYRAIANTPVGALGPILTNTLINRLQNGAQLSLRYGQLPSGDFNNTQYAAAVTGILPAGLGSSVTVTGGVIKPDCSGCDPQLMLGLGGDLRLTGMSMGTQANSPLFTVSLDGELGYGRRTSSNLTGTFAVNMLSGYVGVPVALVQRGTGMQFAPFITPAFAFAQSSSSGTSESGSGLMLGGGLGIYNMLTNVSVNVGAQHSFMNGARNTLGLNVTIGGK